MYELWEKICTTVTTLTSYKLALLLNSKINYLWIKSQVWHFPWLLFLWYAPVTLFTNAILYVLWTVRSIRLKVFTSQESSKCLERKRRRKKREAGIVHQVDSAIEDEPDEIDYEEEDVSDEVSCWRNKSCFDTNQDICV